MTDQSPYVLNPHYYAFWADSFVYEETTYALVHRIFNWIAFVSGFITCSVCIYMILYRTPDYFKQFSRILLVCTCIDMAYLLLNFGCQVVSFKNLVQIPKIYILAPKSLRWKFHDSLKWAFWISPIFCTMHSNGSAKFDGTRVLHYDSYPV
jgi:hypothetical protein